MGELAICIAAAALLLSFVHVAAAAAQETNPSSQHLAMTREIEGLVRQVGTRSESRRMNGEERLKRKAGRDDD